MHPLACTLALVFLGAAALETPHTFDFMYEHCQPHWVSVEYLGVSLADAFATHGNSFLSVSKENNSEGWLFMSKLPTNPRKVRSPVYIRRTKIQRAYANQPEIDRLKNVLNFLVRAGAEQQFPGFELLGCYYNGNPYSEEDFEVSIVVPGYFGTMEFQDAINSFRLVGPWLDKMFDERIQVYHSLAKQLAYIHSMGFVCNEISSNRIVYTAATRKFYKLNSIWNLHKIGEPIIEFMGDACDANTRLGGPADPRNDIWSFGMVMAEMELKNEVITGDYITPRYRAARSPKIELFESNRDDLEKIIEQEEMKETIANRVMARHFNMVDGRRKGVGSTGEDRVDVEWLSRFTAREYWRENIKANLILKVMKVPDEYAFHNLVLKMIDNDRDQRIQKMETVVKWLELIINRTTLDEREWPDFKRDFLDAERALVRRKNKRKVK